MNVVWFALSMEEYVWMICWDKENLKNRSTEGLSKLVKHVEQTAMKPEIWCF